MAVRAFCGVPLTVVRSVATDTAGFTVNLRMRIGADISLAFVFIEALRVSTEPNCANTEVVGIDETESDIFAVGIFDGFDDCIRGISSARG